MGETVGADWPVVRDAVRELDVSSAYVARLIRDRRIRAVRTRLGYLIDPASLAAFAAERIARQRKRSATV
jgi:excisionase family DNA binding protein